MIYKGSATAGNTWKKSLPLFGNATNIVKGAAVVKGTTAGTNQGYGIVAPTNTSMTHGLFLGVTENLFPAATVDNDPSVGTKYIMADVTIDPDGLYEAQYDNAGTTNYTNGLTLTAVTTGTPSVTITSLEAIDGGWISFLTTLGIELHYVDSVSGGVATLKSATSSLVTTSTKAAKHPPLFSPKITLVTAADKIAIGTAAQGAVEAAIIENYVRGIGYDNVLLDPTKMDGVVLPIVNSVVPAVYATIKFTESFLQTFV